MNARVTENRIAKIGFQLMGLSYLLMIFFFTCLALDVIYFTFFETSGYTIFIYIGWIFAGFFFITMYLGLTMPPWLKKRIESAEVNTIDRPVLLYSESR